MLLIYSALWVGFRVPKWADYAFWKSSPRKSQKDILLEWISRQALLGYRATQSSQEEEKKQERGPSHSSTLGEDDDKQRQTRTTCFFKEWETTSHIIESKRRANSFLHETKKEEETKEEETIFGGQWPRTWRFQGKSARATANRRKLRQEDEEE